jgi:hypothetical protein
MRRLLAGICTALAIGACDETFEPLAETNLVFSVYGYLDAAADTQWIRVMPIRQLLLTEPDSFDTVVTLEHTGTGRVVQLRDSVFRFYNYTQPGLGSEGVFVHNFWTTERIEPGATYRFSATRNGQEPAQAVVVIPRDYTVEVGLRQGTSTVQSDYLRLSGLKYLPFVRATTYYYDQCGSTTYSVPYNAPRPDGAVYTTPVAKAVIPPRVNCGALRIERRELWAAASEEQWPTGVEYSATGLAVQEQPSNISHSVGFIGGVLTKVTPYEDCMFQGPNPVPTHCVLSYGGTSASIRGVVRETRCNDGAQDSAVVTLSEIDRTPIAQRKIRTFVTPRTGEFAISALEPGIRYALRVRPKPEPDPFFGLVDIHTLHYDTLVFQARERRGYDVAVQRLTQC